MFKIYLPKLIVSFHRCSCDATPNPDAPSLAPFCWFPLVWTKNYNLSSPKNQLTFALQPLIVPFAVRWKCQLFCPQRSSSCPWYRLSCFPKQPNSCLLRWSPLHERSSLSIAGEQFLLQNWKWREIKRINESKVPKETHRCISASCLGLLTLSVCFLVLILVEMCLKIRLPELIRCKMKNAQE